MTAAGTDGASARPWKAFTVRFVVLLALGLCPWPGLGGAWTRGYCGALDAIVLLAISTETAQFRFKPADDPRMGEDVVPWRMYVYAQQPRTGRVDRVWKDERLGFVSIVTFLALALALPARRRSYSTWGIGLSSLFAVLVLNDLDLLVLTLARWGWLSLSPLAAVVLSAAHTMVDGLPSMTYVIPALILAAVARRGPVTGSPVKRQGPSPESGDQSSPAASVHVSQSVLTDRGSK